MERKSSWRGKAVATLVVAGLLLAAMGVVATASPGETGGTSADTTFVQSVLPSGSSWSGASWNGASFDGSSWSGSSWSGSSWDGSSWSGSSWDLASSGIAATGPAWSGGPDARRTLVCVVDSGVDYDHPALAPYILRNADGTVGYDVLTGKPDGRDVAGHGTHVAGIITATAWRYSTLPGVAPPLILPVRVLNADGKGTEADLAKGINYCSSRGANIISMSLGATIKLRELEDAVKLAYERGALLIAAVGNDACKCKQWPAGFSDVLAVSAYNERADLAEFSSSGKWVDLSAPGVNVLSTWPGGGFAVASGTSQATPWVSGAAALVWSAHPALTNRDVARVLTFTAKDMGKEGKDERWGVGAINVPAALATTALVKAAEKVYVAESGNTIERKPRDMSKIAKDLMDDNGYKRGDLMKKLLPGEGGDTGHRARMGLSAIGFDRSTFGGLTESAPAGLERGK